MDSDFSKDKKEEDSVEITADELDDTEQDTSPEENTINIETTETEAETAVEPAETQ